MSKVFTLFSLLFLPLHALCVDKDFNKDNWIDTVGFKGYTFPKNTFCIMDYGAVNNGIVLTTQSYQAALDAYTGSGGGFFGTNLITCAPCMTPKT